jgi:hypothetical protein
MWTAASSALEAASHAQTGDWFINQDQEAPAPTHTNVRRGLFIKMRALDAVRGLEVPSDPQKGVFAQQLVTVVAYTEAFLADTLRAICRLRPEIVQSSQKELTWALALSFPDRESLLAALIDDFVSSRVRATDMKGFVTLFVKEQGLEFQLDPDDVASMALGEQVRHLLVHNGGRVDRKFLRLDGGPRILSWVAEAGDEGRCRRSRGTAWRSAARGRGSRRHDGRSCAGGC